MLEDARGGCLKVFFGDFVPNAYAPEFQSLDSEMVRIASIVKSRRRLHIEFRKSNR